MWHVLRRKDMRREFWMEKPERKRSLGRPGVFGRTILNLNLKK
jgi:hypothetical protein